MKHKSDIMASADRAGNSVFIVFTGLMHATFKEQLQELASKKGVLFLVGAFMIHAIWLYFVLTRPNRSHRYRVALLACYLLASALPVFMVHFYHSAESYPNWVNMTSGVLYFVAIGLYLMRFQHKPKLKWFHWGKLILIVAMGGFLGFYFLSQWGIREFPTSVFTAHVYKKTGWELLNGYTSMGMVALVLLHMIDVRYTEGDSFMPHKEAIQPQ